MRTFRNISDRGFRTAAVGGGGALRAAVVTAVSFCVVIVAAGHFKTGSRFTFQTAVAGLATHPVLAVDFAAPPVAVTASATALTGIDARRPAFTPAVISFIQTQTRLVVLSRIGGRHGP